MRIIIRAYESMWRWSVFVRILVVSLAGSVDAIAQNQLLQKDKADAVKLSYHLKVRFVKNEVSIDAYLTNRGQQPVTVYWPSGLPSTHRFHIVHEATTKPIATQHTGLPDDYFPFTALREQFKTIGPDETVGHENVIGGEYGIRAFFRQPGRYVIQPTFRVETKRVLDPTTDSHSPLKDAWTGTVIGEPLIIDVPMMPQTVLGAKGIFGKVLVDDDKPFLNGMVELYYSTTNGSGFDKAIAKQWDQTQVDAEGRFEFPNVPDGYDFSLTARSTVQPAGSLTHSYAAMKRGDEAVLRLPKGIRLCGKIVDSYGISLSDAQVSLYKGGAVESTFSGHDGTFSVVVREGKENESYSIGVSKRGRNSVTVSATRAYAISGQWTIPLNTENELAVEGIAQFSDGSPVSKADIDFALAALNESVAAGKETLNRIPPSIRVKTNADGGFRLVLPRMDEFKATAIASDPYELHSRRKWMYLVPKISVSSEPLHLIFENRGSISLSVVGLPKLPGAAKIDLSVRSTDGPFSNQTLIAKRVSFADLGTVLDIDRLEPGVYEVGLGLPDSGIDEQKVIVKIPVEEPFTAIATIRFPSLALGSVHAKFLLPDNKTEASNVHFDVYGSKHYHRQLYSDELGLFVLDGLPFGEYWMTQLSEKSLSPNRIRIRVADEARGDLGTIRLRALEEDFGWVEGEIAHEANSPLGRVTLSHLISPDKFLGNVDSDSVVTAHERTGAFRMAVPKGKAGLVFQIEEYGLKQRNIGALRQPDRTDRMLIWGLDIAAGETSRRSLTVPDRASCRDLTVHCCGLRKPQLEVFSSVNNGLRWMYRNVSYDFKAGEAENEATTLFAGFPSLPTYALATGSYQSGPLFMLREIPSESGDAEVSFDKNDLGSLRLSVLNHAGEQHQNFRMTLNAMIDTEKLFVVEVVIPATDASKDGVLYWLKRAQDGSLQIPNLGSGRYAVTISDATPSDVASDSIGIPRWQHSEQIDLRARHAPHLRFQLDAEGKLLATTVSDK